MEQGSHVETFVNSLLIAEALAMRSTLFKAHDLRISKLSIRSDKDSQVLIGANRAITNQNPVKEFSASLKTLKALFLCFP